LFKKCDKIHNLMHYVQINALIKKIRIWAQAFGTGPVPELPPGKDDKNFCENSPVRIPASDLQEEFHLH
jgi:hypothetical protein